jgi:hypothetical protein
MASIIIGIVRKDLAGEPPAPDDKSDDRSEFNDYLQLFRLVGRAAEPAASATGDNPAARRARSFSHAGSSANLKYVKNYCRYFIVSVISFLTYPMVRMAPYTHSAAVSQSPETMLAD